MKRIKDQLKQGLPYLTLAIFIAVASAGAFVGGVWGVAGIAGALLLWFGTWKLENRVPRPSTDFIVLAVLTLADFALLNIFSSRPDMSWFRWECLAFIFLPLVLFTCPSIQARANPQHLFGVVLAAMLVGIIALGLELAGGGLIMQALKGDDMALAKYNRGFSYLVLLAFPVMAAIRWDHFGLQEHKRKRKKQVFNRRKRWSFIAIFVLLLFIPAELTESRAAKLALGLALIVMLLAQRWPVDVGRCLNALPVLFMGWPFAAQAFFSAHHAALKHIPDSWHQRVEIWDYMSYRILERPLLGWGLGTSNMLDYRNPHGGLYVFTTAPAPHPHNAIIQLWVETGLPGLALGLTFAFLTLHKANRLEPRLVPFALGAWMAALTLSMVAYNLWTESLFAAFALTGFAFVLLEQRLKTRA